MNKNLILAGILERIAKFIRDESGSLADPANKVRLYEKTLELIAEAPGGITVDDLKAIGAITLTAKEL